jgi:glycosyltransferase involved in cell wall biosynthesis
LSQVAGLEEFVEVYVSNNASTDGSREVIQKYLREGYPLNALENETNLGHDKNLEILYEAAQTPYFWLFGDDDFLMPGMLTYCVLALMVLCTCLAAGLKANLKCWTASMTSTKSSPTPSFQIRLSI